VSEWVKPRPDPGLVRWLHEADEDRLFLSVVSLGELRLGIERLGPGRRRSSLERWLEQDLPIRFEGRLLPVDREVADLWGRVTADARRAGRPMGAMDAFLAATAWRHELALVTRNAVDFAAAGVQTLTPWSA
jgi:toxin FitB